MFRFIKKIIIILFFTPNFFGRLKKYYAWAYHRLYERKPGFYKPRLQETYWPTRLEEDLVSSQSDAGKESYYTRLEDSFLEFLKQIPEGSNVLEIGCHFGWRTHVFAKKMPGLRFTGSDLNQASIDFGKERLPALPNLELEQADATALPYKDNSFGLVYSFVSLSHIPHETIRQALGEIMRVASGRVVFLEIDYFAQSLFSQLHQDNVEYMYFHNFYKLLPEYGRLQRVIRYHLDEVVSRYTAFEIKTN